MNQKMWSDVDMTLRSLPDRVLLWHYAEKDNWTVAHVDYALQNKRFERFIPQMSTGVSDIVMYIKDEKKCQEMHDLLLELRKHIETKNIRARDEALEEKRHGESMREATKANIIAESANAIAKESNMIAKDANTLAKHANMNSETANTIADKARGSAKMANTIAGLSFLVAVGALIVAFLKG